MVNKVLVIIPTFNERESLPYQVEQVRTWVPDAHILVVDDASADGTGEWADACAAGDDHVHVMHRPGKAGLGAAYIAGFEWGLSRDFDVLVEMDADGSHQAHQLPDLLAIAGEKELVIGSRWVPGGSVVNWPAHRRALSRGANLYVRWALGISVADATAGYRAYAARALRGLDLADVQSQGYCFQIDMAWRVLSAGGAVAEVPIEFVERRYGASKMTGSIIREALIRVTLWGLAERRRQLLRLVRRTRA